MESCPNCEKSIGAGDTYCASCGQKTHLHRLSMHEVGHDVAHYFTHADKGFFQLIKALMLKSGTIAREYIDGKRKKYFAPLNFFLLVAAIFVFLINLMSKGTDMNSMKVNPEIAQIRDSVRKVAVLKVQERRGKAIGFVNKYSNFMAMIALPLITLILRLFYLKERYNYTEHLVAGMYMTGFVNLVYILIFVPLSLLFSNSWSMPFFALFIIFQVVYCSRFYYRFIDRKEKRYAFRAVLASLAAILFWTVFSGALIGTYIANGFWGIFA